MLFVFWLNKKNIGKRFTLLLTCLLLTSCTGFAFPGASEMLTRLDSQMPIIENIAMGVAYTIGLCLITKATFKLKIYGEMRTMMSQHGNIGAIFMAYFVGSILCFLPSVKIIALNALFASSEITSLGYNHDGDVFSAFSLVVMRLVQVIGLIAFIRGWVQLSQLSNNTGRHNFGKAMTHIIAGILAINIQATKNILAASIGIR